MIKCPLSWFSKEHPGGGVLYPVRNWYIFHIQGRTPNAGVAVILPHSDTPGLVFNFLQVSMANKVRTEGQVRQSLNCLSAWARCLRALPTSCVFAGAA